MKVVQLNAVCKGSTGTICTAVSKLLTERGVDNYILFPSGEPSVPTSLRYMTPPQLKLQALQSRILGNYGFTSRSATRRLLLHLEEIKPDIVHLHNVHSHNCHLGMLFSYLKKKNIRVYWTFHDCWAFTAYCPHYVIAKCKKWQTGCHHCSQRKYFSWFFDCSKRQYARKKAAYGDFDMTVVTPSNWMAQQVKESFLKDAPVKVIPNGIDLSVFRPCPGSFRKQYGLEEKIIVLGVASGWSDKKGLDSFIALALRLDDRYVCVLVGTDDQVDRRLPKQILSIHRTQNRQELAQIYSDADVFFNPTKEDTYPTVNMEAIACGTPVVTYRTGGSPEIISDGTGFVVAHNVDDAISAIKQVLAEGSAMRERCVAAASRFDQNDRFLDYIALYTEGGASQ